MLGYRPEHRLEEGGPDPGLAGRARARPVEGADGRPHGRLLVAPTGQRPGHGLDQRVPEPGVPPPGRRLGPGLVPGAGLGLGPGPGWRLGPGLGAGGRLGVGRAAGGCSTAAEGSTVAITRAGEYPTPRRPRSPSDTTWKRTAALSSPGESFSSSRSATHFASPTVSPVASTFSSDVISALSSFFA